VKRRAKRLPKARSLLLRDRPAEPDTQPMRSYPYPGSLPGTTAGWQAAPAGPAPQPRTHQVTGRDFHMTVNKDGGDVPWNDRLRAVCDCITLKVRYLKSQGMGYRIDENEQAMQRGEPAPPGSVMADTLAESVTHLMGYREPWDPTGWDKGIRWYDPQVREPWWDGLPPTPQQQADPAQPWHHPAPQPWRDAYERHLGGAA
jgi:hypothetical protein